MKITKTFKNATLRTVNSGYIELDYNGKTHCFNNASVVSVNNGIITIEVDWKPKKGELIKVIGFGINCYVIFNYICNSKMSTYPNVLYTYGSINIDFALSKYFNLDDTAWAFNRIQLLSVTPEEQQAFEEFCKSKGMIWNKEKLQWEKYRWKPTKDEWYYFIDHSYSDIVGRHRWANDPMDNRYYDNYNCFQTKEEALIIAKKLTEFLKSL